ncbi:MAG: carboxypeptidase-like regulatory domain-containing protein [candidate division WOR-3 bacterium]
MNLRIIFIVFILFITITNCVPERDNPYDLSSPNKPISTIYGKITKKNGISLNNCHITLSFLKVTEFITTSSDSNGNYLLQYYYKMTYGDSAVLYIYKDGFETSEKKIFIDLNRNDTINFTLDALPQFSAESVTSYHEAALYPQEIYKANFSVKVYDSDGISDIDTVFITIPALNFKIPMDYYPNNIYKKTISSEILPDSNLEILIGQECYFEVYNQNNFIKRSKAMYLTRIINEIPQPIYPYGDTVSQPINFVWDQAILNFPYNYFLEIFLLPNNYVPQLIYQKDNILSSDSNYVLPVSLEKGRYLWQIGLKDNFNNISKSYQTLFYIE